MERPTCKVLDSFPNDVAERVLSCLPRCDLPNLRLVNQHWKQLTNRYVTQLRPQSLATFLRGNAPQLFPSLKTVDLSSLDVVDDAELLQVAQKLAEIPKLDDVTLSCGWGVTKHGFMAFGKLLPKLHRLKLTPVRLGCTSDEAWPFDLESVPFESFSELVHLDLSWNTVTLPVIQSVASLPKLQSLNLKKCLGVDDTTLETLTSVLTLRSLNLSCLLITDDGLMMLNDLELETLNLSNCEAITDDGMFWLQHIRSLQKVDVSGCPEISSAGIEQLTNLPNLKDLYLQDMTPMGSSFFKKMEQLNTLSLRGCNWVRDETLKDLVACKTLQSINLRNCRQITDSGLKWLHQLPLLHSVNLRGCMLITDNGLNCLSLMKRLEDIDLSFLNQITDAGLEHLSGMPRLRRLILNWCNLITSVGLHGLPLCCPQLKELSFKGCHNMQSSDLVSMASLGSGQTLDYEHSLCSVHQGELEEELPLMRHIDSVGCFMEIC